MGEKTHTSEPPAYFLKNRNIKLHEIKYCTYTHRKSLVLGISMVSNCRNKKRKSYFKYFREVKLHMYQLSSKPWNVQHGNIPAHPGKGHRQISNVNAQVNNLLFLPPQSEKGWGRGCQGSTSPGNHRQLWGTDSHPAMLREFCSEGIRGIRGYKGSYKFSSAWKQEI